MKFIKLLNLILLINICFFAIKVDCYATVTKKPLATSKFESTKSFVGCDLTVKSTSTIIKNIKVAKIDDKIINTWPKKSSLQKISKTCQFDLDQKMVYNKEIIELTLNHEKTQYRPRVYYWQKEKQQWIPLISTMYRQTNKVSADVAFRHLIFAVFVDKTDQVTGTASWYKDKRYPLGGATNIYPLGTEVLVTNLVNNKNVKVKIVSTWADKYPKRVIDLTSTAFQKIGKLSDGLVKVKIERIK